MCTASNNFAPLQAALIALHERYQVAYQAAGVQPQTEYIAEWDAPCYAGEVRYSMIPWKAVRQQPELDFNGVEKGLELELNEQLKSFYGLLYAADLHLTFDDHPITLSQVMAEQDGERLQRNLIAHVLMKYKLQQSPTLFIGTSEESEDLIISVDNESGEVGLEYAGKPQHAVLAKNLTEFLQQVEPRVITP